MFNLTDKLGLSVATLLSVHRFFIELKFRILVLIKGGESNGSIQ